MRIAAVVITRVNVFAQFAVVIFLTFSEASALVATYECRIIVAYSICL